MSPATDSGVGWHWLCQCFWSPYQCEFHQQFVVHAGTGRASGTLISHQTWYEFACRLICKWERKPRRCGQWHEILYPKEVHVQSNRSELLDLRDDTTWVLKAKWGSRFGRIGTCHVAESRQG